MNAPIVPLDLENLKPDYETGPYPVLKAMAEANTSQWTNYQDSVYNIARWWERVSSYDPDVEPEFLIKRPNLNALQKDALSLAAVWRVRPSGIICTSWGAKEIQDKANRTPEIRALLKDNTDAEFWRMALFDHQEAHSFHVISQWAMYLVPEHPFVQVTQNMGVTLYEALEHIANNEKAETYPLSIGIEQDLC